jgi:hypothetical protein
MASSPKDFPPEKSTSLYNIEKRTWLQKPFFSVEGLSMNKGLLHILRINVPCPKCQQINMATAAELIASPQFACSFCEALIDVSHDQKVTTGLDELKDFIENSYIPK